MSQSDAVWITGVGVLTPLGADLNSLADALLAGRSGVGPISHFDVSRHGSKIAAPLRAVPALPGWDEADFARLGRVEQVALWCCAQALRDAGWWDRRSEVRLGLVLGQGAEWMRLWFVDMDQGGNRIRAPEQDRESVLDGVRRRLGLRGPGAAVAAACASGNVALGQARRWVERGWVDVCLAAACDLSVTPMGMACFGNLGAMSRRNADPAAASRPFDRDRDGFVMGEGGAAFVLEAAGAARRRGAHAYAEAAGFGASSDASHIVIPGGDPGPAARAMRAALADAGVSPDQIDYLNAHAPGTPAGDRAEARVLQTALGEAAAVVPVSSTKSMTGHLLGAAAAVEAAVCLAALQRRALPPTINLDNPDPECNLCHVANEARPAEVRIAVSNSFGFGGSNTCLVLRKVA